MDDCHIAIPSCRNINQLLGLVPAQRIDSVAVFDHSHNLTRLRVERKHRVGVEIVARPIPAVVVARRGFRGDIEHSQLGIRRDGCPEARIASVSVRRRLAEIRTLQDKFAFVAVLIPLAAAAAIKDDQAWAARVLGASDAVSERTGAAIVDKSVQALRERTERAARARLGPEQWASAYAAGRSASIDSLIKDIDRAQ